VDERRFGAAAEIPGERPRWLRWLVGGASLVVGAGAVVLVYFMVLAPRGKSAASERQISEPPPITVNVAPPDAGWMVTPSGLMIVSEEVGTGAPCVRGGPCRVSYTGWLWNHGRGARFDSSKDRGDGSFSAQPDHLIPGFAEAITRLRAGGRITVVIPPHLGYGDRRSIDTIPPKSTLLFEIELLDVPPIPG